MTDESSPYAGSVVADESGEAPEGFEIKGNEDSKKYHVPGSQWYDQTQPEVWFATAEDAEAAGFVPAGGEAAQDVDRRRRRARGRRARRLGRRRHRGAERSRAHRCGRDG